MAENELMDELIEALEAAIAIVRVRPKMLSALAPRVEACEQAIERWRAAA